MKSRLFVVNSNTLQSTIDKKEVSILVPEPEGRRLWNKTIIDIMSDLFQVEIGDYIFLWETSTNERSKIYGVYRAISKPYYKYEAGNIDPFKIKIDLAYKFSKPIDEYDVINNPHMKNSLWTIIGKKIAGKSRGTTPITKDEMQFLIRSLIDKNQGVYEFIQSQSEVMVENALGINLTNEYVPDIPASLESFDVQTLYHRKGQKVHYEKSLEAILNFIFRERKFDEICQLGIDINNVTWFANYLPYGIERSEIDYMVIESSDGTVENRINVIELMRDEIDIDHIKRTLLYSKWVKDTITQGKNIVRPILICGPKSSLKDNNEGTIKLIDVIHKQEKDMGINQLEVYKYEIANGEIKFTKLESGDSNE